MSHECNIKNYDIYLTYLFYKVRGKKLSRFTVNQMTKFSTS